MQEPIKDDEAREITLGPDPLSEALRSDLRDRIERIIREELYAALGAGPYERTPERRGYLHSPRERTLTTAEGTATITVPRGRLFKPAGGSEEWQSQLLPRCARRTREVDAALIGLYLSGTNTRPGETGAATAAEGRAAVEKRGVAGGDGAQGPVRDLAAPQLRNLEAHAPKRLHDELRQDYREIVYAEDERAARRAWLRFTTKWKKLCPAVVESLDEAGHELLTFYRFPESQWKGLRTTNIVERVIEEFRRRFKTQAVLPSEDSALLLLYGLAASGQLRFRKLDGYQELDQVGRVAA